jgi:hypothetical protein
MSDSVELNTEANADANRYSILSGVFLLFACVGSIPLTILAVISDWAFLRAIGVLLIPTSIFAWIFTTIRAIHLMDLRYWKMSSTYVAMIFGTISLALLLLAAALLPKDPHIHNDPTMFIASGLVAAAAVTWCFWSNWKITSSVALAVSLTIIQALAGPTIVFVIFQMSVARNNRNSNN